MAISVYLSNDKLQAVIGEGSKKGIQIKAVLETALPEGCLINGTIADEGQLQEEVARIWKEYQLPKKDVALVVESNQIISRQITVPGLKDKEVLSVIEKEFMDIDKKLPLYDYMQLKSRRGSKTAPVIASFAEGQMVEAYIKLFNHLGVSLVSITSTLCAAVKLFEMSDFFTGKTCVVMLMENNGVTSYLLENGTYIYHSRTRLFAEEGTVDRTNEISRVLSTMVQFEASRKSGYKLEQVYFGGLTKDGAPLFNNIALTLNLEAGPLEAVKEVKLSPGVEQPLSNMIYAAGNLIRGKNDDINYYVKAVANPERDRMVRLMAAAGIVFGALLLTVLGLFTSLKIQNVALEAQIASHEAYINNPMNAAQYARAEEVERQFQLTKEAMLSVMESRACIASYPLVDSSVFQIVSDTAGVSVEVSVTGYDEKDGRLHFDAVAPRVEDVSSFIDRLSGLEIFNSVYYTGYSYSDSLEGYVVDVVCVLSETAGK